MNNFVSYLLCLPAGVCLYVTTNEVYTRYGAKRAAAWAVFFIGSLLLFKESK